MLNIQFLSAKASGNKNVNQVDLVDELLQGFSGNSPGNLVTHHGLIIIFPGYSMKMVKRRKIFRDTLDINPYQWLITIFIVLD